MRRPHRCRPIAPPAPAERRARAAEARAYLERRGLGADVIETHTYGATRHRLARDGYAVHGDLDALLLDLSAEPDDLARLGIDYDDVIATLQGEQ